MSFKNNKFKVWVGVVTLIALTLGAVAGFYLGLSMSENKGNHTDEMKMEYRTNYNDSGANSVERKGDHSDSPYFYDKDFYNAKPENGLYIIPQFKTIQQTSWWSCGVSCTEMVLEHFGKRGDWNEKSR